MDKFESLSHTAWDCKYHVVFIPKCRRRTLYRQLRQHLGEVFRKLAGQKECRVEEGHLMPDHVHMMLSIPPKYSVSQVVGFVKTPQQPPAKLEARVLNHTLKRKPKDGSTHWSSRKLAEELGDVSFSTVQRIWRAHGVRPHRLERHMVSNDPEFETKAADVIGLYLNPPAHAAVFCVDEKTAIQALDRKDRMLPLSPGRAESHGFEYKRNGTLSLFAALNTATGEVLGRTAPRHTSE